MALGFAPISAQPIAAADATRAGLSLVAVEGVSASLALGAAEASGVVRGIFVAGVEAVFNTPIIGSWSANGKHTVYLQATGMTCRLGISVAATAGVAEATGVSCFGQLSNQYIVNGTFVPLSSLVSVTGLGLTTQIEQGRWMKIVPSSTPGWVEITVSAPIE